MPSFTSLGMLFLSVHLGTGAHCSFTGAAMKPLFILGFNITIVIENAFRVLLEVPASRQC